MRCGCGERSSRTVSNPWDPALAGLVRLPSHSLRPGKADPTPGPKEVVMATDPVCKMKVDESKAAGKSEYKGQTYYFCAQACKLKFDQNPQQYAK